MMSIKNMVQTLYDKKILVPHNNRYVLSKTAEAFLMEEKQEEEIVKEFNYAELAHVLRTLYPAGIKSGSFYVKSAQSDVERKLKLFFNRYPEYTATQVKEAVSNYVATSSKQQFRYMKLLGYFIMKDNESMLAGYIDNLSDDTVREEKDYKGDVA